MTFPHFTDGEIREIPKLLPFTNRLHFMNVFPVTMDKLSVLLENPFLPNKEPPSSSYLSPELIFSNISSKGSRVFYFVLLYSQHLELCLVCCSNSIFSEQRLILYIHRYFVIFYIYIYILYIHMYHKYIHLYITWMDVLEGKPFTGSRIITVY